MKLEKSGKKIQVLVILLEDVAEVKNQHLFG